MNQTSRLVVAPALPHVPLRQLAVWLVTLCVAQALGSLDLQAQSMGQASVTVSGRSNPFLAGQAGGVACCSGDSSPAHSPVLVPIGISGGSVLQFTNATGLTGWGPSSGLHPPEGAGTIFTYPPALGISTSVSPASALLGVFLPATVSSAAPPLVLNFGTAAARDFAVLTPELFQSFFIGNGLRNDNVTVQDFIAPAGATRLFLGIKDGYGWYNNLGEFHVTVTNLATAALDLGGGCGADPANPPALFALDPVIGQPWDLGASSFTPSSSGFFFASIPPVTHIPITATCTVHVDYVNPANLISIAVAFSATGQASLGYPIANDPGLLGLQLNLQAAAFGTGAPLGVDISNGLLATVR